MKVKQTIYEYRTRLFPNETRVSVADDIRLMGKEWKRVWADITPMGTFVVYRKENEVEVEYEK